MAESDPSIEAASQTIPRADREIQLEPRDTRNIDAPCRSHAWVP